MSARPAPSRLFLPAAVVVSAVVLGAAGFVLGDDVRELGETGSQA